MYICKRRTRSQSKKPSWEDVSPSVIIDISTPSQDTYVMGDILESPQNKITLSKNTQFTGDHSREHPQSTTLPRPYRHSKTQLIRLPQNIHLYNHMHAKASQYQGNPSVLFESLLVYKFMNGTPTQRMHLITQLQIWKRVYHRFFKKGYKTLEKMDEEEDLDVEDKRIVDYQKCIFNYIDQAPSYFNETIYFTSKSISQASQKNNEDSK